MQQWHEQLADQTPVLIRPIHPADAPKERAFLLRLSEPSRHQRFLGVVQTPMDDAAHRLTHLDYRCEMALIALVRSGGHELEVGAAAYCLSADRGRCHCTVAVDDTWRNLGLGTTLMRHLIEVARANGVERMVAVDAAGCEQTHKLAARLGFRSTVDREDPATVIFELAL